MFADYHISKEFSLLPWSLFFLLPISFFKPLPPQKKTTKKTLQSAHSSAKKRARLLLIHLIDGMAQIQWSVGLQLDLRGHLATLLTKCTLQLSPPRLPGGRLSQWSTRTGRGCIINTPLKAPRRCFNHHSAALLPKRARASCSARSLAVPGLKYSFWHLFMRCSLSLLQKKKGFIF